MTGRPHHVKTAAERERIAKGVRRALSEGRGRKKPEPPLAYQKLFKELQTKVGISAARRLVADQIATDQRRAMRTL